LERFADTKNRALDAWLFVFGLADGAGVLRRT
jgi:hypothetical protein